MKLRTHKALTKAAAYSVGIRGGPLLEALLRGVEEPDANPEEELRMKVSRRGNVYFVKRYVRHHTTANRDRVMRLLWRARRLWLSGRTVEAAYTAGYALHYIQDMCVSSANHEAEEASAANKRIPLELMDKTAASTPSSPSFLENVIRGTGPSLNPLETASVVSAVALASVFGSTEPPAKLIDAIAEKRGSHLRKMAVAGLSTLGAIASLPTLPLACPVFLAVAACAYAADGEYRRLKREAGWFKS